MDFSFFLFFVLIFVRVHTSSVSPMPNLVKRIDKLVPEAQKRTFTAEFFRDPDNLEILNKAVKNDFENVRKVFKVMWNACFAFNWKAPRSEAEIMNPCEDKMQSYPIVQNPNW
jgi:hypothetical protein